MEGIGDGDGGRRGGFVDRKGLAGLAVALALVVAVAVRAVRPRPEPGSEAGIEESVRGLEDLLRSELWLDAIDSLMVVMDSGAPVADTAGNK
ncbi:MAG: hypothetical protein II518_03240 [Candidatus Methanomethylophilus sp.]|nr:hypothetical protein [Methanomethylophilus sp.]